MSRAGEAETGNKQKAKGKKMSLVLKNKGGDFTPHPEGIHAAVCVDVMELGLMWSEFKGAAKLQPKVKIVFESEALAPNGVRSTVAKTFTASLHAKAKLAEFLGKWRGRPVGEAEEIDLSKLIGASCTLVVGQQANVQGKVYANIDAISKPTKMVKPSGVYNAAEARARWQEWRAKNPDKFGEPAVSPRSAAAMVPPLPAAPVPAPVGAATVATAAVVGALAPVGAAVEEESSFDPEVNF